MIVLLIVAAILITAVVFGIKNNSHNRNTNELLQQNQSPITNANEFTVKNIKVGDKIAGMTVKSIAPYDEEVKTLSLESNAKVRFTGQTTIMGTYYYECPGFEGKCSNSEQRLCFKDLDNISQKKMPTLKDGRNPIWFCFSNVNEAKNLLVPNTGKKTIVIDNYVLNVYPSEVIDTADLISVE